MTEVCSNETDNHAAHPTTGRNLPRNRFCLEGRWTHQKTYHFLNGNIVSEPGIMKQSTTTNLVVQHEHQISRTRYTVPTLAKAQQKRL